MVTNTYEPNNGNLISVEYGNNDIISYQYDDYNRIKKITKEDNIYEYCYNKNGQIYKTKSNSSNKTYYYDDAKRLKEYKYNVFNDIFSIENIYDNDDNIINKKIMLGTNSQSIANSYDKEDYILESDLDSTNIKYSYDELKRIVRKKINNCYDILYDYVSIGNRTSSLIKSITNDTNKYTYNYDNVYNVTDIYLNSNKEHHYEYNIYNELIVDKDYSNNIKTEFLYDNNGNIITKTKKNLLTENIINTDTFEYTDNTWKDLLTKYNNDVITYDTIGNPLTIGNNTLTWINGRQLSSFSNNNLSVSYCYDENGLRTKKTVNGTDTYFYWDGSDILFEKTNNNIINYYYDVNGVIGLKYNNNNYYFIKNVQGDIISIYNSNNQLVAKYEYDSFGNILSIKDSNDSIIIDNTHVAIVNPYRYRGYYYDRETGLYYIKNRYYNPLWGRFINSDTYLGINHDFQSQNIFLYSSNNYISKIDKNGNWFEWISDVFDYLGELLSPGNVGNALAFVGVLSGLDGPAPVGDFIGICAFVPMLFIGLNSNAKETEKIMEKKKEEEVKKEKKKDVTVYFPENPYDFKPKGLVIDEHSGTSNGKIINWQMPVVKITIFEWDEDFDNGSHYHALKPEWNGKHDKKHYYAGDEVPSPWAEIYFGD